ncbi:TBC1 domain family member 25-like [Saccoglossus kowalevskii]|uniref:TBC1 domain family member 25-like n=1 Tax=Saccoglossus kowalevskii TaxID=10224 RepID=A0ABM0GWD1_SACKO|nr:PREDICTED: TBC1 domain family member 25-like [Saccoglossus kowalevskii]
MSICVHPFPECSASREDVAEPVPSDVLPMLSFKGVSHTPSVESDSWTFVDITQLPNKTDTSELNSKFLGLEDWDIISAKEVTGNLNGNFGKDRSMVAMPFVGAFVNQVEKTINKVQRIFISSEIEDEIAKAARPPLSDADFHKFLDQQGRLVRPGEFRLHVYHGGIEPSLRKVAWRHLLNIFPDGMTGEERFYYLKRKANEYADLKKKWLSDEREEVKYITNMVHKDVLRTDRMHKFYAGGDENHNVNKLYNLLCTYALSHPDVSYCQGMSDLASPILYVMKDEAHAYLCFCGVMTRLKGNFMLDGLCMTKKFDHLSMLLRCCDPEFYDYLGEQNASDLFFCYRWLLLELKREFAFHDALSVLEVMWSSLPPDYPEGELELCGPPAPLSPCMSPTDRMRFKFAKQRSVSQGGSSPGSPKSSDTTFEHFDQKTDTSKIHNGNKQKKRLHSKDSSSIESDISEESGYSSKSTSVDQTPQSVINNDLPIVANHFSEPEPTKERKTSDGKSSVKSPSVATTNGSVNKNPYSSLPPPQDFGGGNPFMLFMCLTLLIEHRDYVIGNQLDYNELAMHFDRMVRRHNAEKVLYRARTLFADYLRAEINMTQAECASPVNSPMKRSVTGHKGESC